MILITNNFNNGLSRTLSLVYKVRKSDNLYNDIETHRPVAVFANIKDISPKILESYPFIKFIVETEGRDVSHLERFNPYTIDYVYGFNPFQQLIPIERTFDKVCICDKNEYNTSFSSLKCTIFGNGWPNSYGYCHPSSVYAVSNKTVYGEDKPTDDLINALYFCGKVYGKIQFDGVSPIEDLDGKFIENTKSIVWGKYNYGRVADKFCNFLGLSKKKFSQEVENVNRG